MKYLKPAAVAATAITMSATPLDAGGAAEPRLEPEVLSPEVIEEGSTTTGGFILPLLFLIIIATAATGEFPLE